jgi:hypothetical protein
MTKIDTYVAADNYFSQIPHWVLYADISPQAIRLYAVLQHYANKQSEAWPSRSTLTKEIRVSSTRTVDSAMSELTKIGAVIIEHRMIGNEYTSNRYKVITASPSAVDCTTPSAENDTTYSKILLTKKNQLNITNNTNTQFDEFWKIYPLKVAKQAAMKAYEKALAHASPEIIIRGAQAYATDTNRVPAYTAHPATWLNAHRWLDDALPPREKTVEEKKAEELRLSREKAERERVETERWKQELEQARRNAAPMPETLRSLLRKM